MISREAQLINLPVLLLLVFYFQLRKAHEMQKQMLWHSFQEKNKQLEMEHEKQLAHTIQVSETFLMMIKMLRITLIAQSCRY